jgi:hypothetical protein
LVEEFVVEPQRQIPVRGEYDVIVGGGGTAGIIAAVASARNGAKTLLVERGGFLGGHIATQLLEHSAGWFDAKGGAIVGGLPVELVERLKAEEASPGHVRDDTGYTKFRLPISHEVFKSVVTDWIAGEGVDLLVYSPAVAVFDSPDGRATVVVENKSGRSAYLAHALVDATGDADLAALGGARFLGEAGGKTQPVSLLFKIGGVDHDKILDYVDTHPEDFKMGVGPAELRGRPHVNLWGFGALLTKAYADGVLSLKRNEMHYAGFVETNEAVINATRVAADATDANDLARAEIILRRQVLEFVRFFRKYVPGCENAFLAATAACVGVRESRRVAGLTVLTDEHVRKASRSTDAIAVGGFPIDSHDPTGSSMDAAEHVPSGYEIPYGALVPDQGANVIVAGRSISAERKALASARITGTCMAMGQAAGTAAALSATSATPLPELDVARLQERLREQGAILAAP